MRTTLTIDDDVLVAVHERARRERLTAGQVLSQLARDALTRPEVPSTATGASRHGFRPIPSRGGIVTNSMIDQMLDDEPE